MHAFLINDKESEIQKELGNISQIQNAKILNYSLKSINDSRDLKKIIKYKFKEKTAIVIKNFDNATIETQNSFLKNLEEPSPNLYYVLTAQNLGNILPTIMSRCQIIKKPASYQMVDYVRVKKFAQSGFDIKSVIIQNIKDRNDAINFVKDLIYFDYINRKYENQEIYLKTLSNIRANGNVSLQLLNLVVKMNSHDK